ncbi:Glycine--tRNA ligase [endosymbiont DhMRE of Dentiscutata heterogama]|uniref:glycine--tRNA ligase n=1 Tax=endosymbiont DhMRE of Dentiscutata heterogama TaxID=1609546 RepID=UPI000629DBCD|nr:glycine--tRNA ligase [endosymbiont DhMRE of Dentiscutata heterogama]CFW92929.1 Glycine--tRNA ligase [endosymbiont DhMRE of Dentiscutata heterogama]
MSENNSVIPKDLTNYLKHYGFFFPNAEIYGGLAKAWDLGPHGVELKRKLKNLWWKYFITSNPHNVGCDSQIITHPQVLAASGHLKNFHDWLVECRQCRKRYRLDNLISTEQFLAFLSQKDKNNYQVKKNCPHCGKNDFHPPRQFNLLLTTNLEITEAKENVAYLRPETCQGIFTNFALIQRSTHRQLPFGVGQIGKSFRNEITLHHGIFRTREFEQMELEFFCEPEESEKWWNYWTEKAWNFLNQIIVNDQKKNKQVDLSKEELPHYAKKTQDLYFNYHFGWGELCSNSHRGNYDLSQHSQHSQKDLRVNGIIPEVIEVSFGVERLMLATLQDAYHEEKVVGSQTERTVLRLPPLLAPFFVAIIPLSQQLRNTAYQLYLDLLPEVSFSLTYEEATNIGKAYRRQDAIGTYYCLTVDFQTAQDNTLTLRHRDSMKQERITISNLKNYLYNLYERHWFEFSQK